MRAALSVRAVQVLAQSPGVPVPSPCVSVCQMDAVGGLCRGCWRTLDEIAAWSTLPDDGKRAVWQRIASRIHTDPHDQEDTP